jgi:hypothetical protein
VKEGAPELPRALADVGMTDLAEEAPDAILPVQVEDEPHVLQAARLTALQDELEVVLALGEGGRSGTKAVAKEKVLSGDLASMFGIDLDMEPAKKSEATPAAPSPSRRSAAKKAAVVKPAAPVTITGAELSDAGVPSATVQSWRKAGVLLPTEARGVYGRTPQLEERLGRYRRA